MIRATATRHGLDHVCTQPTVQINLARCLYYYTDPQEIRSTKCIQEFILLNPSFFYHIKKSCNWGQIQTLYLKVVKKKNAHISKLNGTKQIQP